MEDLIPFDLCLRQVVAIRRGPWRRAPLDSDGQGSDAGRYPDSDYRDRTSLLMKKRSFVADVIPKRHLCCRLVRSAELVLQERILCRVCFC